MQKKFRKVIHNFIHKVIHKKKHPGIREKPECLSRLEIRERTRPVQCVVGSTVFGAQLHPVVVILPYRSVSHKTDPDTLRSAGCVSRAHRSRTPSLLIPIVSVKAPIYVSTDP
jgi:hypothetical protein